MTKRAAWCAPLAGLAILAASCTTAGGVSRRAEYYGTRYEVCIAAQSAIKDLGGRVIIANCEAGSITGRLDVEGATVQLDVTLDRTPGGGPNAAGEYIELSAHASLIDMEEPGQRWLDQLDRIVDRYLDLVRQRTGRRY
jgi:hypothetical protein